MSKTTARLVALEGINGGALTSAAREFVKLNRWRRAAASAWDASGIFGEVVVADVGAGGPSARTLLLLYAADLAFRLRWEIHPALAAGRLVIAVPYVSTAIAFGRAAGIDAKWLTDMFSFAPLAVTRQFVDAPAARPRRDRTGFVELGCRQILGEHAGAERVHLIERTRLNLKAMARGR